VISGAKSDRKQLARLIARLGAGDVLVVSRLDRLARSTRDLLNLLGAVADKGAGFKSLRDTWADTTTPHGRLMLTVNSIDARSPNLRHGRASQSAANHLAPRSLASARTRTELPSPNRLLAAIAVQQRGLAGGPRR
jgi:hypothetical protein